MLEPSFPAPGTHSSGGLGPDREDCPCLHFLQEAATSLVRRWVPGTRTLKALGQTNPSEAAPHLTEAPTPPAEEEVGVVEVRPRMESGGYRGPGSPGASWKLQAGQKPRTPAGSPQQVCKQVQGTSRVQLPASRGTAFSTWQAGACPVYALRWGVRRYWGQRTHCYHWKQLSQQLLK